MAHLGIALLFLSLSCTAISAAPQIGIGLYGGIYDGYSGLYNGYGQYGGHYGLGHHHHYDHDHYHPHYHHDYHHHHHDDYHHDDYHHGHHHHGHYYKRHVSLPERIIPQGVSFDDYSQPSFQPVIISDPKSAPVDQLN